MIYQLLYSNLVSMITKKGITVLVNHCCLSVMTSVKYSMLTLEHLLLFYRHLIIFFLLIFWQGAAEDSEAKSEELNRVVEELHKLLKDAGEGTRLFTCLMEGMIVVFFLLLMFAFSYLSQQGPWGKVAGDELQLGQECDRVKWKSPSPWERAWQCQWAAFKFETQRFVFFFILLLVFTH